ncbi:MULTISPECIES: hypothetical protein [Exiguobacterium]|uniref:hypothetical protein n=1 Tax=Exiguobacterium TaxID=33986 RepID=UPI001BEC2C1F|nr:MULTISPECIES: hypothetical protein [Exiguobacterium]MCA0979683.1 hypothetical protein [Exiguobacterium aestuarii]MDE0563733.1 hypothetical protein [Exiguobacterium sp. B2(2022)]
MEKEKDQDYPFPGNWSRLHKMIQEADASGERQRIEPILWDWYQAIPGDPFIFMEIFQCAMEKPDDPETLEKLQELVAIQMAEAEEPASGGLQIAQYYIMRDQPFEAAHWINQYLEWQDKKDTVNTQAHQVLQVLKMTEFPAAIAKLKRTLTRGSTGEQIEALQHVHFNIDSVLDNVLHELLVSKRPKLVKLIVLEKAFAELAVIKWSDGDSTNEMSQMEATSHIETWEKTVLSLQKSVEGDEIGTQLLMNYMYTHYPYVPAEKADVEQALVQAKQAILHDEAVDGLAAAILEADLRFTQALLD